MSFVSMEGVRLMAARAANALLGGHLTRGMQQALAWKGVRSA